MVVSINMMDDGIIGDRKMMRDQSPGQPLPMAPRVEIRVFKARIVAILSAVVLGGLAVMSSCNLVRLPAEVATEADPRSRLGSHVGLLEALTDSGLADAGHDGDLFHREVLDRVTPDQFWSRK